MNAEMDVEGDRGLSVDMATTATLSQPMVLPTLASTLLIQEQEGQRGFEEGGGRVTGQKNSGKRGGRIAGGVRTGVERLDRDTGEELFSSGRVVGFGGVSELHPQFLLLVHNLISTHIIETNTTTNTPSIFILEPPTTPSTTSSLLQIYTLLEKHSSTHQQFRSPSTDRNTDTNTKIDAETLISQVSILPYFDLIGISQGLTEISESMSQDNPQLTGPAPPISKSGTTTAGNPCSKIILLRSLGSTLAQQLYRSNSNYVPIGGGGGGSTTAHTRIFALLGQVLGQLRRLARSPGEKVLVLVEIGVESGARSGSTVDRLTLRSSFSSAEGRGLRLGLDVGESEPDGGGGSGNWRKGVARGNDLATRLVEDTLDDVIVLHDGFGVLERDSRARVDGSVMRKCILEVLKDISGGNMGRWAVWDGV